MIGIVNVQWFDNPGAVLLAYALQQTVSRICRDDTVIIDYAAGGGAERNKKLYNRTLDFARKIYHNIRTNIKKDEFLYQLNERHKLYEKFREDYLVRTKRFNSLKSCVLSTEFSHCIVGSDVVWKPEITNSEHSQIYYLKAIKTKKRISYAASIGTDRIEVLEPLGDKYNCLLKDFDYISVREQSAKNFLQSVTDKEIKKVLDPVFLLSHEDYLPIIKSAVCSIKGRYIYLYLLGLNDAAIQTAVRLAEERNCSIVYDVHSKSGTELKERLGKSGIMSVQAGPAEFLSYIANAEFVISNSFHCTAFSIIFHKEFLAYGRINAGIDISVRMRDLCNDLALSDRYCGKDSVGDTVPAVNYELADKGLNEMRKESIDFLKSSLK